MSRHGSISFEKQYSAPGSASCLALSQLAPFESQALRAEALKRVTGGLQKPGTTHPTPKARSAWFPHPVLNLAAYGNRENRLLRGTAQPGGLRKSRKPLALRYGATWRPTKNAKTACRDVCQNLAAYEKRV